MVLWINQGYKRGGAPSPCKRLTVWRKGWCWWSTLSQYGKRSFNVILCQYLFYIVCFNNSPRHFCLVLPSEHPGVAEAKSYGTVASTDTLNDFICPESVYCCASASGDISREISIKFFIRPRPPRSGVGVIKVQEGKQKMDICMRYNDVSISYHWKLDEMEWYQRGKSKQT